MDDETQLPASPPNAGHPQGDAASAAAAAEGVNLAWVWREVRKRVFIKLPFSLGVADAMEAVVPITLTNDAFVCGLSSRDYPLSGHLNATQVRNTIENILRQAASRPIHFELIEGTCITDWEAIQSRQLRAHSAVVAIAEKKLEEHHYDDVLNQVVSELRVRIMATSDRTLPQVRAHLMLQLVPQLADIEEMLFAEQETHDRRRSMARALDRIASFLEVTPFALALEVERFRMFPQQGISVPRKPVRCTDDVANDSVEPPRSSSVEQPSS